jgi:hypothetical protein
MNNFYKQPKILQWIEAILLLLFGFIPALAIIEIGYSHPIYYLLLIIYVPVGQFSFTPFFKLIGVYKYYSPMLLGYIANERQIDLHSGGSFDYLFVMRKCKSGIELRNRLLMYHLEGLLKLIELIDNKSHKVDVCLKKCDILLDDFSKILKNICDNFIINKLDIQNNA